MLKEKLLELRDPRDGRPVVDEVWYREEVYTGEQARLAPDLLFKARDYGFLGRQLFGSRKLVETSENMGNGFHRMNGMFLAYGPGVRSGVHLQGADITDIAPTVLYAMGLPVPADMDGRVLTEVWPAERTAAQPVTFTAAGGAMSTVDDVGYTAAEMAEVEARLEALGYLD
jgi:predicted AlkP superfamily phosphohydrolase/phosphomutase